MTDLDTELEKIDRVLSEWETVKGAYGLSQEIIERGRDILAYEKLKVKK